MIMEKNNTSSAAAAQVHKAIYELKADTNLSYYRQSGSAILPRRVNIRLFSEFGKYKTAKHIVGDFRGIYSLTERSPVMRHKPFNIHSKIFRFRDVNAKNIGFAPISITGENGRIDASQQIGIVVVKRTTLSSVTVYYFPAAQESPEQIKKIFNYVLEK